MRLSGALCLTVLLLTACEERGETPVLPPAPTAAPETAEAPRERAGLFGRLFRRDTPAAPQPTPGPDAETPAVETPATDPAPRRGLLAGLFRRNGPAAAASTPSDGPDGAAVTMGTAVPYGEVARLCDVPPRRLGRVSEKHGNRFRIHDPNPGSTSLRTLYITGFKDGCARQVTAALALFGGFDLHERLRYGLPAKVQPYSTTDDAYETLKRRVCGSRKGKPCGTRMRQFSRDGVFVSLYERFEGSPRWKNLLLYDGEVIALDVKTGG